MTENKCKCMDCQSNDNGMCMAPEIELDYGENGGCMCMDYVPVGDMGDASMPNEGGLIADAAMMDQ
jgi:hypothetical protein